MTNEQMNFPKTWEEYEQEYGFNDSEEVYTNNSRLIPSFRVKQWLDQESKTGHWIELGCVGNDNYNFECSECHHTDTQSKAVKVNYCWYCGARMVQESEE